MEKDNPARYFTRKNTAICPRGVPASLMGSTCPTQPGAAAHLGPLAGGAGRGSKPTAGLGGVTSRGFWRFNHSRPVTSALEFFMGSVFFGAFCLDVGTCVPGAFLMRGRLYSLLFLPRLPLKELFVLPCTAPLCSSMIRLLSIGGLELSGLVVSGFSLAFYKNQGFKPPNHQTRYYVSSMFECCVTQASSLKKI